MGFRSADACSAGGRLRWWGVWAEPLEVSVAVLVDPGFSVRFEGRGQFHRVPPERLPQLRQHVGPEDLDPVVLCLPDVVQRDLVETQLRVRCELGGVPAEVGGDLHDLAHPLDRDVLGDGIEDLDAVYVPAAGTRCCATARARSPRPAPPRVPSSHGPASATVPARPPPGRRRSDGEDARGRR